MSASSQTCGPSFWLILMFAVGCDAVASARTPDPDDPPTGSQDDAPASGDREATAGGSPEMAGASRAEGDGRARRRPRPCPAQASWPDGMACVRGGWFTLGSDEGRDDEAAPGEVFVETFFMDLTEVTNGAYEACIEAGRCERPMRFRRFMGDRQPVVAVSWYDAAAHCEMQGGRLPTEAEWERAASGPEHTRYPWGDDVDGDPCELANVKTRRKGRGCGIDRTRPVGSYPAGHWGLFDMAGNVHEWVQDRYSACLQGCRGECGDACFGIDPKGPCGGGTDRCPGHGLRSVRGGSWYWPLERARTTARRGSGAPNRGPHRFGFRCARDVR